VNRRRAQAAPAEKYEFSLISNDTLMALYERLLHSKARGARRSPLLYSAAQVAVEMDLLPGDTLRLAAKKLPSAKPRNAHPVLPITVDLLDVLGAALSNRTQKNRKVALLWASAANPSHLRDIIEAARIHKLGIVFVSEVDGSPDQDAVARLLNRKVAPGEEMPHITVDGNDVVASYRVAHEAIDRARRDRGPTLIECVSYRLQGQPPRRHVDPVANMERYLRGQGLFRRGMRQQIIAGLASVAGEM
jgi:pyruvate dehydrogenase E1 component alpha subunit